jgi:hypothetical protein
LTFYAYRLPKISAGNLAEINFTIFTGDIPISGCYIPLGQQIETMVHHPTTTIVLV